MLIIFADLPVMMLTGFLFLLLLTGGSTSTEQPELLDDQQKFNYSFEESGSTSNFSGFDHQQNSSQDNDEDLLHSERICSYQDVFNHLNLTKNKELYAMARPVKDYKEATEVDVIMVLYGILDVREIDQTFIPYLFIYMSWINKHISWRPEDFCGLHRILVPTNLLWTPEITFEQMTEKDKAPPNPYLSVRYNGEVEFKNDLVMVSTCRMQVYKFPFDIQSCNLSLKSVVYFDDEMKFKAPQILGTLTEISRELMETQYEWLFLNMTVKEKIVNIFGPNQTVLVYTIRMRRRSVLYIANFLVPITLFFGLDLASFLISDSGGEKLSFKVTVLLAITVMQLILNDILPSSSDRVPLVAVYCIGMFGLMLLSLLETILVMYLIRQDNKADNGRSWSEDSADSDGEVKKWTHCACVCDVSADEAPSELLSVTKEGDSSQLTEESTALEKVSDELKEVKKTLILLLNSNKEEEKLGYWTRVTKTINKVFFIFYVTAASVFLTVIFSIWNEAEDE